MQSLTSPKIPGSTELQNAKQRTNVWCETGVNDIAQTVAGNHSELIANIQIGMKRTMDDQGASANISGGLTTEGVELQFCSRIVSHMNHLIATQIAYVIILPSTLVNSYLTPTT